MINQHHQRQSCPSEVRPSWPGRDFPLSWMVGFGLLIVGLRLPYIGHVLAWDEAWNLCALKSLAGGSSIFTIQFWRHPPIYLLLGRLLAPLSPGLDARMELLSLALNTCAILAFILVVSRLFGRWVALCCGLAYSVLPGTLFFDTWVKCDPVATLFGILSLLAYLKRKHWLTGLLLGLALLGKETAIFYVLPYLVMPFIFRYRQKRFAGIGIIYALGVGISVWWYLFLASTIGNFKGFFLGTSIEASGFASPWWYYAGQLPAVLGWPGLLLFSMGGVGLLCRPRCRSLSSRLLRPRLLPLVMILPAFLLLSLSNGKTPWMTMSLYPFLALVVSCGWLFCTRKLTNFFPFLAFLSRWRLGWLFSALFFLMILGIPGFGYLGKSGYIRLYEKIDHSGLALSRISYGLADEVNNLTRTGERLMIMPMLYRNGPLMPDPIFFWQLKVPLVVIRSTNNLPLDSRMFRAMVVQGKLDWVLMSPISGSDQETICLDLYTEQNPPMGYSLNNTVLLKVGDFWRSPGG